MTKIIFPDYPDFKPNVTPLEMFSMGVFGGTYWRPIYSSVTGKKYKNQHLEFSDFSSLDERLLTMSTCDYSVNYFGVAAGSSLEDWESKGWIVSQDPYGWVQWYCRFFYGRRWRMILGRYQDGKNMQAIMVDGLSEKIKVM